MIAMTVNNGVSVRLTADYNIDTETVNYEVHCFCFNRSGSESFHTTFEFNHFGPAAKVYKSIGRRVEGGEFTDTYLKNLVAGAKAMGYIVMEVA